jgi:hypothetical protein
MGSSVYGDGSDRDKERSWTGRIKRALLGLVLIPTDSVGYKIVSK